MAKRIQLLGRQVDSLICINDSDSIHVVCKCIECGEVQTRSRSLFLKALRCNDNHLICKNINCKYYSKFFKEQKYKIGDIFGVYKLIERLSKDRVKIQCVYCGDTRDVYITNLKDYTNGSYCRNKSCVKYENTRESSKYKIGNEYNNLRIIRRVNISGTYYRYIVKCTFCGCEFSVTPNCFKDNKKHCSNVNCENHPRKVESDIGLVYNDIECVGYVKVNNRLCYKFKCLVCGEEFIGKSIGNFKNEHLMCKNIKCKNSRFYDYSGIVTEYYKTINVVGQTQVLVECLSCGEQFIAYKDRINKGLLSRCPNKNCVNHIKYHRDKLIGKKYGDYIVDGISQDGNFILRCTLCGKVILRDNRPPSSGIACAYHPRQRNLNKVFFDSIYVSKYEFTYKGLDYFTCKCQKCGKKDILNVKQMLEHRCNDGKV